MGTPNCWAASLGECSSKGSKEHLVSKGLFVSPQVRMKGFPWCKTEEKVIGLGSAVGKVLCEKHNNALSPVDVAGIETFDALRRIQGIQNVRAKLSPRRWRVVQYRVNGPMLECWFLKTLINLALSGRSDLRWELGDTPLWEPPSQIVNPCFGLGSVAPHIGLYVAAVVGQESASDDTVEFAPLIRHDKHIGGGLFRFRGCQFIVSLSLAKMPSKLDWIKDSGWYGAEVRYHLETMNFQIGTVPSQSLVFDWNC